MKEIGDKVRYVPAECHDLDRGVDGAYAWEFAYASGRDAGTVMTDKQVFDTIKHHRETARKLLKPVKPKTTWPAVVRTVHEDGSLDLDITAPQGGVTLHYDHILPSRKEDNKPHTWTEE